MRVYGFDELVDPAFVQQLERGDSNLGGNEGGGVEVASTLRVVQPKRRNFYAVNGFPMKWDFFFSSSFCKRLYCSMS